MPVVHDYLCEGCGAEYEAYLDVQMKAFQCKKCPGTAIRIYRSAPAFNGKSKGLYPRFDHQLGVMLESSQHKDRVAKERGLIEMGPEEFNRSASNSHEPAKDWSGVDDAMEKAWSEVEKGYRQAPEILDANDVMSSK